MEQRGIIVGFLILICGIVVLYVITNEKPPSEKLPLFTTTSIEITPTKEEITTTTERKIPEEIPLSDLQITACEAANEGGTCFTRLNDLGLVSPEECCEYLKLCC